MDLDTFHLTSLKATSFSFHSPRCRLLININSSSIPLSTPHLLTRFFYHPFERFLFNIYSHTKPRARVLQPETSIPKTSVSILCNIKITISLLQGFFFSTWKPFSFNINFYSNFHINSAPDFILTPISLGIRRETVPHSAHFIFVQQHEMLAKYCLEF